MSWVIARVGNYTAKVHEDDDEGEIEITVRNLTTKTEKDFYVEMPDNIRDWLFAKVVKKGVSIIPCIKTESNNYYLISPLMDSDIVLTTDEKVYNIETLKELDWLGANGFVYK